MSARAIGVTPDSVQKQLRAQLHSSDAAQVVNAAALAVALNRAGLLPDDLLTAEQRIIAAKTTALVEDGLRPAHAVRVAKEEVEVEAAAPSSGAMGGEGLVFGSETAELSASEADRAGDPRFILGGEGVVLREDEAEPLAPEAARVVASVLLGGALDGINGFLDLTDDLSEALIEKLNLPPLYLDFETMQFVSERPKGKTGLRLPEIAEGDGQIEQTLRDLVQFGVAFTALGGPGGGFLRASLAGAGADATFDPTEGNLATVAREFGFENELTAFLDSKVGEDATALERLESRAKNAIEGAGAGAAIEAFLRVAKAVKSGLAAAATYRLKSSLEVPGFGNGDVQIIRDRDGRPLVAKVVVGQRTQDGPDIPITIEQSKSVARDLTNGKYFEIPPELMEELVERGTLAITKPGPNPPRGNPEAMIESQRLIIRNDLTGKTLLQAITHEHGHLIDFPLDLKGRLDLTSSEGKQIQEELIEISQRMRPLLWEETGKDIVKYRKDIQELFADGISSYEQRPEQTRRSAPTFTKWLRAQVNSDPVLSKIIQFNSAGALVFLPAFGASEIDISP